MQPIQIKECHWGQNDQSLIDTDGSYHTETLELPQHSPHPYLLSAPLIPLLTVEWALLHHVDESWFKFETAISDIRLQTSPDVGIGRS
jgi:hypothetical protein